MTTTEGGSIAKGRRVKIHPFFAEVELQKVATQDASNNGSSDEEIVSFTRTELTQFVQDVFRDQAALDKCDVEMEALNQAANSDKDETDDWHSPFGESTYTLIYMSSIYSQAFWYAILIFFIQISTIILTLADIIDWHSDNSLKVPPMVDPVVSVAQAVATFLAIGYQSDLIEAVLKLQEGYFPDLLEEYPGATYFSWLVSCIAQLIAGLLLLISTFVLTMQVDNVLAIMLNFAALTFMAEIDDLGFYVARKGFVRTELQLETEAVANFRVPKRNKGKALRRCLFYATLFGLFIGYGILKRRQLDGKYLPTYLYVQFGDSHNHKLPYYSGLLSSTEIRALGRRQYRDLGTQTILLAYCVEEEVWTFSESNDPCDYFAKSPSSNTYDVTTIPNNQWLIKQPSSRFVPFESFSLVNHDCDENVCQGTCVEGLCVCPREQYGIDCEFGNVCPTLIVDQRREQFPLLDGTWASSDTFELFYDKTNEPVKVYNMPVYYSNTTFPASFIFFGGLRWVLTSELGLLQMGLLESYFSGPFFPEKTAETLQSKSFHGHHEATHIPYFLSDPVDFHSPDFQPTPIGLGWSATAIRGKENQTAYAPSYPIETVLQCQTCLDDLGGFCNLEGGTCNPTTGRCDCKPFYFGDRCDMQKNCFDQSRPCGGHGQCGYDGVCSCHLPWYGKLCDFAYGCMEEDGQCFNGGTCNPMNSSMASIFCECPDPATVGSSCEARKDCTYFGCQNGGVCNHNTGMCNCDAPFHGFLCGLVNDTGLAPTLTEHQYNCTKSGCSNFGTCNNMTELCECDEPFTGPDCTNVPDCSTDADCPDGGTCDVENGRCSCMSFLFAEFDMGKRCELFKDCRIHGCSHGGTCLPNGFCNCDFPYTGYNCNFILDYGAY